MPSLTTTYHESSKKPESGMNPHFDNYCVWDDTPEDDPEAAPEYGDEREPGPDVEVGEVGEVVQTSVVSVRKSGYN